MTTKPRQAMPSLDPARVQNASPASGPRDRASPGTSSAALEATPGQSTGRDENMAESTHRQALPGFRWDAVELLAYKPEGAAPFKDITRQLLFRTEGLACELRYFEVAAGGHSTLERHEHEHAVMVLNGSGRCLVGDRIHDLQPFDLVTIPAMTWHQFRASGSAPFGFLCMVNVERDRPQLPDESALNALRLDADIADFIRA